MTCIEVQEWISRFVDDDLEPDLVASMFSHLGGCPDCQRMLQSVFRIRSAVAADTRYPAPAGLDDNIRRRLGRSSTSRSVDMWAIRLTLPIPAAVAMAVMIIVGSMVVSPLFLDKAPLFHITDDSLQELPTSVRKHVQITRALFAD